VEDTGTGDFAENTARVLRQSLSQIGPSLRIERSIGIEIISAVEDSPNHVPLGETNGVVSDRVQHTTVDFSLGLGVSSACRAMPEGRRPRRTGGPFCELLDRRISQSVMQPHSTKPTVPLGIRYSHLFRPPSGELCYPLDMVEPCRCDDGPLGQSGPQPRGCGTGRRHRYASGQLSPCGWEGIIRFRWRCISRFPLRE
jgi:hypothetical protein